MKYAIIGQIVLDLPAKRDNLKQAVQNKVVGKAVWAGQPNSVVNAVTEDGKPSIVIEQRFDNKADQTELASFLAKQKALLPFVTANITTHDCYHDEGGRSCASWQDI